MECKKRHTIDTDIGYFRGVDDALSLINSIDTEIFKSKEDVKKHIYGKLINLRPRG